MALIIKDRVKETTTTAGTGTITLAGASTGFRSFADIGNANTTYYTIAGGNDWEVGLGTYTASGTTLSRDTVLSNSLGTTAKIDFSAGTKDVFCTYPSEKALLGDTSAVSSTGTGNVVLNSNPTFATDITVNGLTVGRGDGNISTNTALGVDAIGSPYITSTNTNNVGIGYGALNQIGSAVASLNSATLVGGSGYNDDYNGYIAGLTYLSGTPPIAGAESPDAFVYMSGGQIVAVSLAGGGFGWTALDTVFAIDNAFIGGVGSGASIQIGSLTSGATNNTAVGVGAGSGKIKTSNSVYLGYNTTGTGSNQILIGSNVNTGNQNNVTIIGNSNTTSTIIKGQLTPDSFGQITTSSGLTVTGTVNLSGSGTANQFIASAQTTNSLTIGGTSATGLITLGRSTGAQTVNIATGANSFSAKTVNIGTGGTGSGGTTVNIASNTGVKTVNIGTNNSVGSTATINIGSTSGVSSTTTINGSLRQQTFLVYQLPAGVAGARSFVTDALSPTFGAAVVGGGAVGVPVYHDGGSWKVG